MSALGSTSLACAFGPQGRQARRPGLHLCEAEAPALGRVETERRQTGLEPPGESVVHLEVGPGVTGAPDVGVLRPQTVEAVLVVLVPAVAVGATLLVESPE